MPIAAAVRSARAAVPMRRGASTRRTTAIPAERAGRPTGPTRCSIHSAEVLAPGDTLHAQSGARGDQSPYHEAYKGNASAPVWRSPRHGQRFPRTCRHEVHRSLRPGKSRDEAQSSRLGKRSSSDAGANAQTIIEPHRLARSSVANYVALKPRSRRRFPAKRLWSPPSLTMTRDLP